MATLTATLDEASAPNPRSTTPGSGLSCGSSTLDENRHERRTSAHGAYPVSTAGKTRTPTPEEKGYQPHAVPPQFASVEDDPKAPLYVPVKAPLLPNSIGVVSSVPEGEPTTISPVYFQGDCMSGLTISGVAPANITTQCPDGCTVAPKKMMPEAIQPPAATPDASGTLPLPKDAPQVMKTSLRVFQEMCLVTGDGGASFDLAKQLIRSGTSVNAPMRWETPDADTFATLLHVLASRPDLPHGSELIGEVVRARANINARSLRGSTPLACACTHKHQAAAEFLLGVGASTSPSDDFGRNALHCAVSIGRSRAAGRAASASTTAVLSTDSCFIPDGALPSTPLAPEGAAPIEAIAVGGDRHASDEEKELISAKLVGLLAGQGADLNQGLLEAILQSNRPAVSELLQQGAKPRFLHNAVEVAPAGIVEDLLNGQANPLVVSSKDGKSVLDVAFQRGDEEITTLLRDAIGDLERRTRGGSVPLAGDTTPPHREVTSEREPTEDAIESTLGLSRATDAEDGGHGSKFADKDKGIPKRFSNVAGVIAQRASQGMQKRPSFQRLADAQKSKGEPQTPQWLRHNWAELQLACKKLNQNNYFQVVMFSALISVLFLPDLWIIADVSGNHDLDIILVVVFCLFIVELTVQMIGTPASYINSFFFWMDVVGLLSVPMDHSVVSDSLPQNFDNAVVMRAARTARLGARAGRFTKLVKLLRFLPGVQQERSQSQRLGTAKSISSLLMMSLSTRVSCLIILMVMVLPLFDLATYPENDFSMKSWLNSLDFTYRRFPSEWDLKVGDFVSFYASKDYYPFEIMLEFRGNSSSQRLNNLAPRRDKNIVEISSDSDSVRASFNFGSKNRVDAVCNMALLVTVIVLMMGFSLLLSNSVSTIVLEPLENLLSGVKLMASKIFRSVSSMATKLSSDDDGTKKSDHDRRTMDDAGMANETELLERVIDKLAALSQIMMKSSPVDAETLEQLGETDTTAQVQAASERPPAADDGLENRSNFSGAERRDHNVTEDLVDTLEKHLREAGLAWGTLDSWDFSPLDVEDNQRQAACLCFLIFSQGFSYTAEMKPILCSFIEDAAGGYLNPKKVPYHNWYHAVDVAHGVFRLLNLCAAERILGAIERHALIVSAICHDIGHPGLNNPFLVETSHELAIRYNDHSPLENMHCARLFEIVSQPKSNVFSALDKLQYREVRQVCIEAILHTDNTHHFTMVKELQVLYEMNSDMFDMSLQMYHTHRSHEIDFPPKEIVDILAEGEKKKLVRNLFLHFSDISNPAKPFQICKSWAWLIVDEFFLQGDREKELGITVQPLNDREKVNRAYSQVGFIEFFVAPFAFATVRVLPPVVACVDQLMQNLNSWCEEWVTTTTPTPDSEEQAKLQERIAKLEAKYVFRDGC